jgi:putative colanic acid biosynthesis acetyltransferase WcaF
MLLWLIVSAALFHTTPKPLNAWRLFLLRLFGCKISGRPFVHGTCIIKIPWQLTLEDRAALGPKSEVYNLGHVTLKRACVVSQYAYICGGTHDLNDPGLPLQVGDIVIGEEAFLGAKTSSPGRSMSATPPSRSKSAKCGSKTAINRKSIKRK